MIEWLRNDLEGIIYKLQHWLYRLEIRVIIFLEYRIFKGTVQGIKKTYKQLSAITKTALKKYWNVILSRNMRSLFTEWGGAGKGWKGVKEGLYKENYTFFHPPQLLSRMICLQRAALSFLFSICAYKEHYFSGKIYSIKDLLSYFYND